MKDEELSRKLEALSRNGVVKIERLTASGTESAVGLSLKGSSNPLYAFRYAEGTQPLGAIAFTSILNAQARPATRAEALGQAIATHGEQFFSKNPFLLIFDYSSSSFMAVSAIKLFAAFAREAQLRQIPYSDTANFSLTPNFAKQTINMYGSVGSEDVWFCPNVQALTQADIIAGIEKIAADGDSPDLGEIVDAVRRRIAERASSNAAESQSEGSRLSYTASLVTQGRHKFYSLTMPSEVLADCSFVLTRDEDKELGFQRYLSKDRAQEIASYLDSGLGTIPTSVIISAQPEAELAYDNKNRTLSFNMIDKAFMIIDGQHRVYGFKLAKGRMRVPVIIYGDLNRSEEAQLFIDINGKQKQVPPELLLDIKRLANTQGDAERSMGIVFDLFDSEPGSSLLGLLSPHEKRPGLISRVTFNAAVKPLMDLFGDAPPEKIYASLNVYFDAVKRVFGCLSDQIEFTSPAIFRGMATIFPEVQEKVRLEHNSIISGENYYKYLTGVLSGQKIGLFKGRLKTHSVVVAAMKEAMRPKMLL